MKTKHLLAALALAATATGVVAPAAGAAPLRAAQSSTPRLHVGSTGSAVAHVQRILGVRATGRFGSVTAAAVKRFQRAHHLPAVGYVGPATWKALLLWEQQVKAKSALALARSAAAAAASKNGGDARAELAMIAKSSTADVPVVAADLAVIKGDYTKVSVMSVALVKAARVATSVGQARAIEAKGRALGAVNEAIAAEVNASMALHPTQSLAWLGTTLDTEVKDATSSGIKVDPTKEAALRKAALDALQSAFAAATSLEQKVWSADPFAAGSAARIIAWDKAVQVLPAVKASTAAMDAYDAQFNG